MSVLFNSSSTSFTRNASLPAHDLITACFWFRLNTDRNNFAAIFGLVNAGLTQLEALFLGSDGVQLGVDTSASLFTGGSTLTVGTWYHIAYVRNGSSHTVYLNGVSDVTLTDGLSFTPGFLFVGGDTNLDANFAAIKIWDAALSAAEIVQEMQTYLPARTANIHLWTPCLAGSGERARDYSGNGRNWTEGGTLTDGDNPPISWAGTMPLGAVIEVTSGGTLYTQSVSGSISPAGALVKQPQKVLSGGVSPAGALVKEARKVLAGAISPAGALVKEARKVLAGAISPAAELSGVRLLLVSLSGSITPSGSLVKEARKVLSGSIEPAGGLSKRVYKSLAGTLSATGALIGAILGISTPESRTYVVAGDYRVLTVNESRTYAVAGEYRVLIATER